MICVAWPTATVPPAEGEIANAVALSRVTEKESGCVPVFSIESDCVVAPALPQPTAPKSIVVAERSATGPLTCVSAGASTIGPPSVLPSEPFELSTPASLGNCGSGPS